MHLLLYRGGGVRGAMATRHGTDLKLVVHQSVFKDFYTLMKQMFAYNRDFTNRVS